MTDRLKGKVAMITGTGSGIGRAAALLFAAEGAKVAGCAINADQADETSRMVREAGGEIFTKAPLDVSDPRQVGDWVDEVLQQFGRIDILYNNAGRAHYGLFEDLTLDEWHASFRDEVDVAFVPIRAVWPHLKTSGGGSIINTSSLTAHRATGPAISAHGIGKGAIASFAPHLAIAGGPYGIRVNTISPGLIWTSQIQSEITLADAAGRSPLGRAGKPEDVALVALFLASDDARFVTGADYIVDGGQSAVLTFRGNK